MSVGGQDSGNRDEACQNRSSTEPCLNPDILEEIVRQTLRLYPYMRSSLRAVFRFFRNIVERELLPRVYIPELNDVTDIRHVSVRKIILLKGKNSGAVLRLKETAGSLFQVFIGNGRAIDDASNNSCIQCAFCREPWIDLMLD